MNGSLIIYGAMLIYMTVILIKAINDNNNNPPTGLSGGMI